MTDIRDAGTTQLVILESGQLADWSFMEGAMIVLRGFPDSWTSCLLGELWLDSYLVRRHVSVAVVKDLPIERDSFVLANPRKRMGLISYL